MNNTLKIEETLEISGFSMRNISDSEAIFVAAYEKLYPRSSAGSDESEKISMLAKDAIKNDKKTLQEISAFCVTFELFPRNLRLIVRKPDVRASSKDQQRIYLIENGREMIRIDQEEITEKLRADDLLKNY